ncbi:MAG: hypothetical protein AAGC55_32485, partial [Myxococcota bacterium]
VKLHNPGAEPVAMPTVIIPIPAGFRVDESSLKTLVKNDQIARFENNGSQINLYLTELVASASLTLPYRLDTVAACDVLQRPARAYAYYDPEVRGNSAATRLIAQPRRK